MRPRSTARHRVALLIETSNRYGRDLLYGVHDWVTQGAKWSIRLAEQSWPARLPPWLQDWQGDGIIARVDTPAIAAALRRTGLPVVDVSAERARSEFPRVSIDNAAVARLAVEHFTGKAARHYAYCGDARFLWSQQRGRSFVALIRARGGRCHTYGLGLRAGVRPGSEADLRAMAVWLSHLPRPVSVFACYDSRAQQVLTACLQLGLAVPGEVAVLGVDNDEVLCELCEPSLSSILPNARRTGYEAAAILSRLLAGRTTRPPVSRAIEPLRVVERLSTDAVAGADPRIATVLRYIRSHACDGINVGDVLRAVPMSRTLLDRRCQALLGHSPHHLIRRAKVERVRQLLVETDIPVARIADLTGFDSPSYLSAAFRRETGASPLAFRLQHRAGPGHRPAVY